MHLSILSPSWTMVGGFDFLKIQTPYLWGISQILVLWEKYWLFLHEVNCKNFWTIKCPTIVEQFLDQIPYSWGGSRCIICTPFLPVVCMIVIYLTLCCLTVLHGQVNCMFGTEQLIWCTILNVEVGLTIINKVLPTLLLLQVHVLCDSMVPVFLGKLIQRLLLPHQY